MRTYVSNMATTMVPKDATFSTVTRGTTDNFSEAFGHRPGGGRDSQPQHKLFIRRDLLVRYEPSVQAIQRSAYISPNSNFLRITQRGMANVNIGGRYNEKVQLHIPTATQNLVVVQLTKNEPPEKEGPKPQPKDDKKTKKLGFSISSVEQPLYHRVDAVVVSVAVVRHPTELRPTKRENFGLHLLDVADTEFIVGLPRPSKLNLWRWDRLLTCVMARELLPETAKKDNEQIYSTPAGPACTRRRSSC